MFLRSHHHPLRAAAAASAAATVRALSSSTPTPPAPWFVSPHDDRDERAFALRFRPPARARPHPHPPPAPPAPVPHDAPEHLRRLHAVLCASPHLEAGSVTLTRPVEPAPGPPLPPMRPRGVRRRRGGTDAGVGIDMASCASWSWFVLAQVKEGSERKGSIESVMRLVRKTLAPSVPLPPNKKYSSTDGWAMLDVGDFAVHVLSQSARMKWFSSMYYHPAT